MMYMIHIFRDGKLSSIRTMPKLPRTGETLRLSDKLYVRVTEVIWCIDEPNDHRQRINLRTETIV